MAVVYLTGSGTVERKLLFIESFKETTITVDADALRAVIDNFLAPLLPAGVTLEDVIASVSVRQRDAAQGRPQGPAASRHAVLVHRINLRALRRRCALRLRSRG